MTRQEQDLGPRTSPQQVVEAVRKGIQRREAGEFVTAYEVLGVDPASRRDTVLSIIEQLQSNPDRARCYYEDLVIGSPEYEAAREEALRIRSTELAAEGAVEAEVMQRYVDTMNDHLSREVQKYEEMLTACQEVFSSADAKSLYDKEIEIIRRATDESLDLYSRLGLDPAMGRTETAAAYVPTLESACNGPTGSVTLLSRPAAPPALQQGYDAAAANLRAALDTLSDDTGKTAYDESLATAEEDARRAEEARAAADAAEQARQQGLIDEENALVAEMERICPSTEEERALMPMGPHGRFTPAALSHLGIDIFSDTSAVPDSLTRTMERMQEFLDRTTWVVARPEEYMTALRAEVEERLESLRYTTGRWAAFCAESEQTIDDRLLALEGQLRRVQHPFELYVLEDVDAWTRVIDGDMQVEEIWPGSGIRPPLHRGNLDRQEMEREVAAVFALGHEKQEKREDGSTYAVPDFATISSDELQRDIENRRQELERIRAITPAGSEMRRRAQGALDALDQVEDNLRPCLVNGGVEFAQGTQPEEIRAAEQRANTELETVKKILYKQYNRDMTKRDMAKIGWDKASKHGPIMKPIFGNPNGITIWSLFSPVVVPILKSLAWTVGAGAVAYLILTPLIASYPILAFFAAGAGMLAVASQWKKILGTPFKWCAQEVYHNKQYMRSLYRARYTSDMEQAKENFTDIDEVANGMRVSRNKLIQDLKNITGMRGHYRDKAGKEWTYAEAWRHIEDLFERMECSFPNATKKNPKGAGVDVSNKEAILEELQEFIEEHLCDRDKYPMLRIVPEVPDPLIAPRMQGINEPRWYIGRRLRYWAAMNFKMLANLEAVGTMTMGAKQQLLLTLNSELQDLTSQVLEDQKRTDPGSGMEYMVYGLPQQILYAQRGVFRWSQWGYLETAGRIASFFFPKAG